jgi:hypothetical protein
VPYYTTKKGGLLIPASPVSIMKNMENSMPAAERLKRSDNRK